MPPSRVVVSPVLDCSGPWFTAILTVSATWVPHAPCSVSPCSLPGSPNERHRLSVLHAVACMHVPRALRCHSCITRRPVATDTRVQCVGWHGQAIISGTFSIIRQSLHLGCFPRVKVVHTSGVIPSRCVNLDDSTPWAKRNEGLCK